MMRKMIKMGALLGAVSLIVSGCLDFNGNKSTYEGNILIHYEPDYMQDLDKFMHDFFKDGADSVSVNENFTVWPVTHFAEVDEDKNLIGGFALCTGIDTLDTPERRPARFAVFDDGGCDKTLAYAVFHDTLATLMPEQQILVHLSSAESSCTPTKIFVQNVQAVVQAVKHGVGLSGGPFTSDDFLTLTIIGYRGEASTGRTTVKLVDGTRILEKWTEVDLSPLGAVERIELHLESSRPDCPLYCCIDNFLFHYIDIS